MAIVNHAFMAGLHESYRHIGTHSTKTNHANLHLRSPMSETVYSARLFQRQSQGL
jgi:hypothetical protein